MKMTRTRVRRAHSGDIPGIIRLVRRCYQEVCSDSGMYDASYLREHLSDGSMVIYLACTEEEEAVGMEVCCERPDFPGTLYLKNKMTHPAYCGLGIGKAITGTLMSEYDFSRYDSLFAYALTYNTISQGILRGYGFHMTGLAYNSFLKSQETEGAKKPVPKRSHAIMVRNIKVEDVGVLYIDQELEDAARVIYRNLGVRCMIKNVKIEPEERSRLNCRQDRVHRNMRIMVDRPGADLRERVREIRRSCQTDPLQTFQLFLNLRDESAVWAYGELKLAGFTASGFKPLGGDLEYVLMYASAHVPVYFEHLSVHESFAGVKRQFEDICHKKEGRPDVSVKQH